VTSQHKSPAAMRTTAIIFAALCCSATALAAVAPLAFSSDPSAFDVRTVVSEPSTTAHAAGNSVQGNANA
jgi:hypothetical protein